MMRCIGISDQSDKFEYVMQLPLQVLPLLAADSTNTVRVTVLGIVQLNLRKLLGRAKAQKATA